MQPSPIQLVDLRFIGSKVWARPIPDDESPETEIQAFDFDGVVIGESIEVVAMGDADDPREYAVRLRVFVENNEGKLAPYNIDVEAAGLFEVNSKVNKNERAELIEVNGCAVLYGAIRDLVLNLTSRSAAGMLMLPTVNFLDRKKQNS